MDSFSQQPARNHPIFFVTQSSLYHHEKSSFSPLTDYLFKNSMLLLDISLFLASTDLLLLD